MCVNNRVRRRAIGRRTDILLTSAAVFNTIQPAYWSKVLVRLNPPNPLGGFNFK